MFCCKFLVFFVDGIYEVTTVIECEMWLSIYGAFDTSVEVIVVSVSSIDVDTCLGECSRYGIISGEWITAGSINFGTCLGECLYENGGLFCDVETASDFISFEGFCLGVLFSESHQDGHS